MASKYTYTQIADLVLDAIGDLSTGKIQSYTYSGKSFTFFNLKDLMQIEQDIRLLAKKENSGDRVITYLRMD